MIHLTQQRERVLLLEVKRHNLASLSLRFSRIIKATTQTSARTVLNGCMACAIGHSICQIT
jgi:hypothetical protein